MFNSLEYQKIFALESCRVNSLAKAVALKTKAPEKPNRIALNKALMALRSLRKGRSIALEDPLEVYLILAGLNLCNSYVKEPNSEGGLDYEDFKPLASDLAASLRFASIKGVSVKGELDRGMTVFYFTVYGIQFSFHCVKKDDTFLWACSHCDLPGFDGVRKQPVAISVFNRAEELYLAYGSSRKCDRFA